MNASVSIQVVPKCTTDEEVISSYVKINYRPEGDVLTIDEKVTKHHK